MLWDIGDNEVFKIEFKPELDISDLRRMKPKIIWLMIDFWEYCKERNLYCCVTSMTEYASGRVSSTHREGRAFDASVRGWKEEDIETFLAHFNKKWANIGTAPRGKEPKAVIYHATKNKDGEIVSPGHLHFQIRRGV